jgi:hypothetical protein
LITNKALAEPSDDGLATQDIPKRVGGYIGIGAFFLSAAVVAQSALLAVDLLL